MSTLIDRLQNNHSDMYNRATTNVELRSIEHVSDDLFKLNKLGYDATFYAVDPDVDYEPFQTDDVDLSGRYTIDEDTDLEQGFWVTAKLKSKAKADAGKFAFVKAKDLVDSPNIASWEK